MKLSRCVCVLGLLLFFSSPSFSQDSLVCIKPSTARYYLEKEDEVYILREKDSISNELIYNQAVQLDLKDKIIASYQADSIEYQKKDEAYEKHLSFVRGQLDASEKEAKKQRRLKWLAITLGLAGLLL